ncbi:MAG: tetratricopeptide repeat protein [Chloroflexi bacterium]|nr:tetratricopeptide repeat protein [Chloroflexota bacterium]
MKSKKYLWIMAIIVMLLAGCGGGGGEEEPLAPTPVPPTSAPAATPTLSAGDHVELGMKYYDQGELAQAVAEFEKAIELAPNDDEAHRNLGTAYGEQGKWEESVAAYEQAIEINPDYGEAYADMTGAYFYVGKLAEATAAGEKGIELAPDYATAYNNLGIVYGSQGEIDTAIPLFEKAIELDPNDAQAHYNLGFSYENMEQLSEAIAEYQEAVRVDPNYVDAYENMGTVHARQGQYEEAIVQFETFLQLAPPNNPGRAQVESWLAELKEATADARTKYNNAAGGYSLFYPTGWYYAEDGTRVSFAESREGYEAPTLESPLVTLFVTPLVEAAEGFGLDESATPAEFLQVMTERIGAETEEIESAQIVGYPGVVAATAGTVADSPYKGNMIMIMVGEQLFLAEAIALPDQWDAFRPTFVEMINSLAFFESGGSTALAVDFTDPVNVLQAVFTAAQTEDLGILSSLCDPLGEGDEDTMFICAITADHPDKDSFVEYFTQAQIASDVVIDGDRAEIPFLFGPDGDQEETMGLVQRDGKWYLSDF